MWGLAPSEFWSMSPQEFWRVVDERAPTPRVGDMPLTEFNELRGMLEPTGGKQP